MNGAVIKDIQTRIKQLFQSGQTDLQSRDFDKDKDEKDQSLASAISAASGPLNKFKLLVLTNAVCVDILVWATKDENGKRVSIYKSAFVASTQIFIH